MEPKPNYEFESERDTPVQNGKSVSEKVQVMGKSIGQTLESASHTAQQTFEHTKRRARAVMGQVVESIDSSTDYLSERGMEGVVEDVETLIRRHPFQALMIGLSIGYLLSRSRSLDS
jgi:ElaB/YqjD/DUF883 family membrane-anchored ribosome-binding protein